MHDGPGNRANRFAATAVGFELLLGLIAILLGWLIGPWPWNSLASLQRPDWLRGVAIGSGNALVLFAAMVLLDRYPAGICRQLQTTVRQQVAPLFAHLSWWHLLLISLAAGWGEEFLFRGFCQVAIDNRLAGPTGTATALLAASLLFGICHWITPTYALVAVAMGLLLGLLLLMTGNLVAPMATHAIYDFLALIYLTQPIENAQ